MNDIAILTIVAFIFFASRGITGPVSSLYTESLGANYVEIGLLGAAFSLTAVFSNYFCGRMLDRANRRKTILLLGLAAMSINNWLTALIPSYEYRFPLSILESITQAAYSTSSLTLMGDLLEKQDESRGRRMGTYRGLGSLGFGIAAFISGTVADLLSIRATFILAAIFMAVAFFLSLNIREPQTTNHPISTIKTQKTQNKPHVQMSKTVPVSKLKRQKPLAPLLVSTFLWFLVIGAVYSVWANYMVSEIGYDQAEMSRLWAIASLSELPFMILAGWLSDRLGRLSFMSLGLLTWAFVFLGYVLVPMKPWIILIQLCRGFAYSAFISTSMTYAAEARLKAQRGRVAGLYNSLGSIGSMLGSLMGGGLSQFTNFQIMLTVNAAIIFIGAMYVAFTAIKAGKM